MTQECLALGYQKASEIVRKARRQSSDLPPAHIKLGRVLKYLGKQAEAELAPTLEDDPEMIMPFLLLDKMSGKASGNFGSFEEAKQKASDLVFWEVWRNGTRLIVVRPGFRKEYKPNC
jgi:hypothetical protein